MTGPDLLKTVLASGDFPNVNARRLRNIVLEAFSPRYLVNDAAPARLLKAFSGTAARDDFRSLCFLFTCRANLVLADFVREVYWPRYAAGRTSVSKEDSLNFIKSGVSEGRMLVRWSDSTVKRVSS